MAGIFSIKKPTRCALLRDQPMVPIGRSVANPDTGQIPVSHNMSSDYRLYFLEYNPITPVILVKMDGGLFVFSVINLWIRKRDGLTP